MTDRAIDLASPPGLSLERRTLLAELARRNEADHGSDQIPPFGTNGWYFRWSFAWAPVLLDRTGGRLQIALHRQATVTTVEAESILVEHDRLDGWLNYAYRALKSDRDGRAPEARLDAAESVPWLLDVIFTLAGRVRPYHKYLPWDPPAPTAPLALRGPADLAERDPRRRPDRNSGDVRADRIPLRRVRQRSAQSGPHPDHPRLE